jgi:hypothetical protein
VEVRDLTFYDRATGAAREACATLSMCDENLRTRTLSTRRRSPGSNVWASGPRSSPGATRTSGRPFSTARCRLTREASARILAAPSQTERREDFEFEHQRSVRQDVVVYPGALGFVETKSNRGFPDPPGTGESHLSIMLGILVCPGRPPGGFRDAAQWVDGLHRRRPRYP